MTTVFFSNRIERLLFSLKEQLFPSHGIPFAQRLIIVPSPAVKSWLTFALARDMGICCGVDICFLNEALEYLNHTGHHSPSSLEIALALQLEMEKICKEEAQTESWKPLLALLHVDSMQAQLSRKSRRRLLHLCEKLSHHFIQYGLYGEKVMGGSRSWQHALWQRLQEGYNWKYPFESLPLQEGNVKIESLAQVHVFGFSHFASQHFKFICSLSQKIRVYFYQLSPCQLFWGDMKSNWEKQGLLSYWKKQGISLSQYEELSAYLQDVHPLLANFGRMGREMISLFDQHECLTKEYYALPQSVIDDPQYEQILAPDTIVEASEQPLSILEAVQADLLILRYGTQTEKIIFEHNDETIQLHCVSSRMREVQVLYHALLRIIERHKNDPKPITPSDIIVMAPQIELYLPYIQYVFGSQESILDFRVIGLQTIDHNIVVQGLEQLFELAAGRWDITSILTLFDFIPFQHRHQLTSEDVKTWREWIEHSNTCWGADASHRDELLVRDYGDKQMVDKSAAGTWEDAFERLLHGVVMDDELSIEPSQAPLLGKCILILRSLREDLKVLGSHVRMTIPSWVMLLETLMEAYFTWQETNENEYAVVLTQLKILNSSSARFAEAHFDFATVRHHLESLWKNQEMGYRDHHMQAVRFCSLLPMRAIPARVLVTMGMQEGEYPRQQRSSDLDLLQGHAQADYRPSTTDYDRYLFLEVILSARDYLLMSYINIAEDGQEQRSSPVISELMEYIEQAYIFKQGHVLRKHCFDSFAIDYFLEDTSYKNYSLFDYRAAVALQGSRRAHQFFSFQVAEENPTWPEVVEIESLTASIKNPLKLYMNKVLGIFLSDREDNAVHEPFVLNALDKYHLRHMGTQHDSSIVVQTIEKKRNMPLGSFGEVARPPKQIAGLHRVTVNGNRRVPCPPPKMMHPTRSILKGDAKALGIFEIRGVKQYSCTVVIL